MAYFAVIDTNVLVSALITKHEDAAPLQVVKRMLKGDIVPLYNDEILQEYDAVLHRPKFRFTESAILTLLQAIMVYGESIDRLKTDTMLIDPKDLVFYEVTMEKRSKEEAYLVTGNKKHFPNELFIITANEMLELMNK